MANINESEKFGATLRHTNLGPQNKKKNIFKYFFFVLRPVHFSFHFDSADVTVKSTDITLFPSWNFITSSR